MVTKLIFCCGICILLSCKPLATNFELKSNLKEINFNCKCSFNDENLPLFDIYLDTLLSFQVITNSKKDAILFHDKTFVVPFYFPFTSYPSNEDQTIIRYYDDDKNEILGRFSTLYIDSSFVDSNYYNQFIDTTTYKINNSDTLRISQQITLPYNKNGLLITMDEEGCNKVRYIKICLSKGKKKENTLFGISCSDFIKVLHN